MGRGDYERLTPEAIDQLWTRMRPVMRRSRLLVSWVCQLRRCVTICIGVAGSDPCHVIELQVGSRLQNARRSPVAWPLASR